MENKKNGGVIVAQLGARMHYGVPRLLHEAGLLECLFTDICAAKSWPRLLKFVPTSILPVGLQRLQGRLPSNIPSEKIVAFTNFGLEYASRRRKACTLSEMTALHLWAGDRFNELIVANGFGDGKLVYGFNSASEGIFKAAETYGLQRIVEQTISPRSVEMRILNEESERFPEWRERATDENAGQYAARELREWVLADKILVASEFVKQQIGEVGGPIEKCRIVPYGVELQRFSVKQKKSSATKRRGSLNVLFIGGDGFRKGVHYLFGAMKRLKGESIHCKIVGGIKLEPSILSSLSSQNIELVGPVSRELIHREYASADVFCLPSLCEGSATVVYEALAAGLPVVTTPNSGSIVRDGVEGYIVPIRNSDAIAERLDRLANDRSLLASMSDAAITRSFYGSLDAYGERLMEALELKKGNGQLFV